MAPPPRPEQQQATGPSFPILTETPHTAEFVLTEGNGNISRDGGYIADPATVLVGTPLKRTAAATTDKPATFTVATVGADCQALALYAGKTVPVDGLRIAVLARNAEVNGRLIAWGAMSTAEQIIGATTLAASGIIVRV
jgi:hypothetical protein